MAKDLYDFVNNDYYKNMIEYEGRMGALFSIRSFFAALGSIFYIMIIPSIITHCPDFSHVDNFSGKDFLLLLCVSISGAYFLLRSFKPLYYQYKSRSWAQVVADITKIYISNIIICGKTGCSNYYFPKVSYEFFVNDKKYSDNKLSFEIPKFEYYLDNNTSSKYDKVNADFGDWVETKNVSIYYNPENPSESVIYRKVSVFSFIIYSITFIVFFSLFGIILSRALYCMVLA